MTRPVASVNYPSAVANRPVASAARVTPCPWRKSFLKRAKRSPPASNRAMSMFRTLGLYLIILKKFKIIFQSQFLINIDWHPWHAAKTSESWKTKRLDFAEVIKKSIWSEMHTKSWCDEAGSYQNGSQTRQPLNLPEILGF